MGKGTVSPRVLREVLVTRGLKPNSRLGQNFLIDSNILRKIIACVAPCSGDLVLEIGPGAGALTQALTESGAHVLAIEIDHGLTLLLKDIFGSDEKVDIVNSDATREDLVALTRIHCARSGAKRAKMVSNLPYYASSEILYKVLKQAPTWESITVMLQREAAERVVAEPGTDSYGGLSVMAQAVITPRIAFRVPPSAFWPKPEVESALLVMIPRSQPMYEGCEVEFSRIVRAAFGQRRKALSNALRKLGMGHDETVEFLRSARIEPQSRGETLSAREFSELAFRLRERNGG